MKRFLILFFGLVSLVTAGTTTVVVDEAGKLPSDSTFIKDNIQSVIDAAMSTNTVDLSALTETVDDNYYIFTIGTNDLWIAINANGTYIDFLEGRADSLENQTNLLWTGLNAEIANRIAADGLLDDADDAMLLKYVNGTNEIWGVVNSNTGDITTLQSNTTALNAQTNLLWSAITANDLKRVSGTNELWTTVFANDLKRISGTNELWTTVFTNEVNRIAGTNSLTMDISSVISNLASYAHLNSNNTYTASNSYTSFAGYKELDSISTNIQSIDYGPPVVTNYTYVTNYGYYSFADERDIESLESGTNMLWYSIITNRDDIATLDTNKANITYVDSGTNMLWYSIITNRDDIATLDTNKADITYVDGLYSDIWTEAAGFGILTTNKSYVTEEGSAEYDFGTTQSFWQAETATGYSIVTTYVDVIDSIITNSATINYNMGSIYLSFETGESNWTTFAESYGVATNTYIWWEEANTSYNEIHEVYSAQESELRYNTSWSYRWSARNNKTFSDGWLLFDNWDIYGNTFTNSYPPPDGGKIYGKTSVYSNDAYIAQFDDVATIRYNPTNSPTTTITNAYNVTNWITVVDITTNITYSPLINQTELDADLADYVPYTGGTNDVEIQAQLAVKAPENSSAFVISEVNDINADQFSHFLLKSNGDNKISMTYDQEADHFYISDWVNSRHILDYDVTGNTLTTTADMTANNLSGSNTGDQDLSGLSNITAIVSQNYNYWDNEAGIGGTENAKYMSFEIPLNPGGYPGYWTDFEIKIEEIDHTTDTPYNMVYYWQSMGDPWDGNNTDYGDTNARCYFIDSHQQEAPLNLDARKWQLYTNPTPGAVDATSLYDRANHADSSWQVIEFFPSHEGCYTEWTNWQWYTNSHNLRASWIRYDAIGPETNSVGRGIWHPIKINWVPKRKNEAPEPQG